MHPPLSPVLYVHVFLAGEPFVLNMHAPQAWHGGKQTQVQMRRVSTVFTLTLRLPAKLLGIKPWSMNMEFMSNM